MKKSTGHDVKCGRSAVSRDKSVKTAKIRKAAQELEMLKLVSEDLGQRFGMDGEDVEDSGRSDSRRPKNSEWTWTATNRARNKELGDEKRVLEDGNVHDFCFEELKKRRLFKNKKTQKNLISPTPSFLPPMARKALISHRFPSTRPKSPKDLEVRNFNESLYDNGEEKEDRLCLHHRQMKKQERKNIREREFDERLYVSLPTKCDYHDRVCLESSNLEDGDGKVFVPTVDVYPPSKNFVDASESSKVTETADSDNPDRNPAKSCGSKKEMPERQANKHQESSEGAPSGKPKEKLVYVVEEDGQNPTKLETDLFSVNEILNIKKNLLELSEFAQKLKKLKELKKESDKLKKSEDSCRCEPISDLLKDINKRIEVLEVRQEQLENGKKFENLKSANKPNHRSTIFEKKDEPEPNLGINEPNALRKCSGSSREINKTKMKEFANDSDIVCELMDIKSQLQKLEERKMSQNISKKEILPKNQSISNAEGLKKKGHAIAVFSSKTYILASPNNCPRKQNKKCSKEDNIKSTNETADPGVFRHGSKHQCTPEDSAWCMKTNKTKENVANWLRSVPPRPSNVPNDVDPTKSTHLPKEDELAMRCPKWKTQFKNGSREIQETKKNRALEKETTWDENDKLRRQKNNPGMNFKRKQRRSNIKSKKCWLTPSGRLFTYGSKSTDSDEETPPPTGKNLALSPGVRGSNTLMNLLKCSVSCTSTPSALVERSEKPWRFRHKASPPIVLLEPTRSRSLQEMNPHRRLPKTEKTARNVNKSILMRLFNAKETKNRRNKSFKDDGEDIDRLTKRSNLEGGDFPVTSSSRSYLMGEINLEKKSESINGPDRNRENIINNPQIFSTTAVINPGFALTEDCKLDDIKVIKCEKINRKSKGKKENRSGCRKCKDKITICKVCKKESQHDKKKEKRKNCSKGKKEKKRRVCCLKEIPVPECGPSFDPRPHCSAVPVKMNEPCVRGRRQCDHHFKSSIFGSSTKCLDCCSKAPRNHYLECKAQMREPSIINIEDGSDFSYRDYQRRYQIRLEREKENIQTKPQSAVKLDEDKSKDACGLTSFFKNLRGLYPRCSYLKFFPTFGMSCEKDEPGTSEGQQEKKRQRNEERITDSIGRKCKQSYCKSLYGNRKTFCYQTQNCCSGKLDDNCERIKVYRQPFLIDPVKKVGDSNDSSWVNSSSEMRPSKDTTEGELCNYPRHGFKPDENYVFPFGRPLVYCTEATSECQMRPCTKKEIKKCKKLEKKAKRKKKKQEKEEKKKKKKKNKCVCLVCGNVHKRKKKKEKQSDCKNVTYEDVPCRKMEPEHKPRPPSPLKDTCSCPVSSESPSGSCESKSSPFFSFLTNFCSKKSKRCNRHSPSIFERFNELRKMKVCKGRTPRRHRRRKKSRKQKKRKKCRHEDRSSFDTRDTCERKCSKCTISHKNVPDEKCSKSEKDDRKKEKEQFGTICTLSDTESCCLVKADKHEKKKKKEKEKKKKKEKKKEKEECESFVDVCQQNPTTAFYCTCQSKDKQPESISTDKTTTTTTTTTTLTGTNTATDTTLDTSTTTATTATATTTTTNATTDQSSDGYGCRLKRKLSSLPVFWSVLRRPSRSKKQFHGDDDPNADYFFVNHLRSRSPAKGHKPHTFSENFCSFGGGSRKKDGKIKEGKTKKKQRRCDS